MPPPATHSPRPSLPRRVSRTVRALWALHRGQGLWAFCRAFGRELSLTVQRRRDRSYWRWSLLYNSPSPRELARLRERASSLDGPPVTLLMGVAENGAPHLRAALDGVLAQTWPHWRLRVVLPAAAPTALRVMLDDCRRRDPRVRVVDTEAEAADDLDEGGVALIGQDDVLAPYAVQAVAEALRADPDAALVYTDEDHVDDAGKRLEPVFKPAASPELLLADDYVGRLAVYRTAALQASGLPPADALFASDHALALRVFERLGVRRVRHLPQVCYHRRSVGDASPGVQRGGHGARQSARAAAAAGRSSEVRHRLHLVLPERLPKVSVVMPTRDQCGLLRMAVTGLLEQTDYEPLELIVVDNQSREPDTLAYLQQIARDPRVRVVPYDAPFNYPLVNAAGMEQASGELLLLLNNDIEVLRPDWLREMAGLLLRPGVGAVGARLYYPDRTLQHAGVVLDAHGVGAHVYKFLAADEPGYLGRARSVQNLSAVTAACMLLRREVYEAVGGMDPALRVAFNDVDLCLRILAAGWRVVYTPYAELVHHESKSRGSDYTDERLAEFRAEQALMRERWSELLAEDRYFSPNLVLVDERPQLAFPPRVARPWDEDGGPGGGVR